MIVQDKKYEMIDKVLGEKEVVRITTTKPNSRETRAGHIASYILKAMICDDKQVYLSYISSATSVLPELITKKEKILILINRMLKDDLAIICGGIDKVPEKYRGKKLGIVCGLPYNKETDITAYNRQNKTFEHLAGLEDKKVKATFVKLHLTELID